MDSIRKEVLNYYSSKGTDIIKDNDQNSTDLQKCLNIIDNRWESVLILGGMGGNFTQEISNLNVLYLYPNKKIFFLSNENLLFLLWPGEHLIHCRSETKVGLIPLGCSCHSITTTGLKWNLNKQALTFGGLVSSSNEMEKNEAFVDVSDPILWIVDFR